jgi:hypothetical protein
MQRRVIAALALGLWAAGLSTPAAAAPAAAAPAATPAPAAPPGGAPAAHPPRVRAWTGTWVGAGVDSRKLGFDIRVRIYEDGSATISYPSEPCDGFLLANGARRGVRIYREKITHGLQTCIDGARVALRIGRGRKLHYRWAGLDNGAPVTARGSLERAS